MSKEIDEKTSKTVGKLFVEDEDSQVSADDNTYTKLFALIGGPIPVIIFILYGQMQKYWENYKQSVDAEFAIIEPELQASKHSEYLWNAFIVSTIGIILQEVRNFVVRRYESRMAKGMIQKTLERVLLAPVNLFFDVTPVGKILEIFQEKMNVFRGCLFDPLKHCLGMGSHVVVVLSLMFCIGGWETTLGVIFIGYLMIKFVPPYLSCDNQLHRVGSTLWGPIHSYFYECMRGTNVIRAFGQEENIMAKQHDLLDRTTLHFIAHHSCWCWYNIRMFYTSKLFYIIALFLIAKYRASYDTISLILLFRWTTDMSWIMHFMGCINWFMRNANDA